jgi:hypothetical protein
MADLRLTYSADTPITATNIATLANAATGTADTVDNTANLFIDALVEMIVTPAAAPSATGYAEIYVKGSIDNTDFDDDNNHKWVGSVAMGSTATTARKRVFSVASAFGGAMPPYWQVFVRNTTGAAFASASLSYRGMKAQSV